MHGDMLVFYAERSNPPQRFGTFSQPDWPISGGVPRRSPTLVTKDQQHGD